MNYIKEFLPLALTSVALSLAFKMRFWNIGGEGQFTLGAIAAATIALKLAGREDLMMMASGSVCLMILLYWGSYLVLRRKF